jgi:hypothetical protein
VILSTLAWLLLALPGYALVRAVARGEIRCGFPGVMAVSYVGTFAIAAPISILGFVLEWPLAVFSSFLVAAIGLSIVVVIMKGWWRGLAGMLAGAVCFEMALLLLDWFVAARVGPVYAADALTHLMHIRGLRDSGLSNLHPAYPFPVFIPIYHTNIYYAINAAIAQLTRTDVFTVWWSALLWAKLVSYGGVYYLGWRVFQRDWAAWAGVILLGTWAAPATFMLYPNKLAPYWLVPIALGQIVWVCERLGDLRRVSLVAATTLVLAQVHSMYAVFLGMAGGPFLVGVLAWRALRGPRRWVPVLATMAALWIPAPFVIASYLATRAPAGSGMPAVKSIGGGELPAPFVHVGSDYVVMRPQGFREACIVVGLVLACRGSRREAVLLFFLLTLSGAAWRYNPLQCTLALRVFHLPWMVQRMPFVLMGFAVLGAGGYVYWLEQRMLAARRAADDAASVEASEHRT